MTGTMTAGTARPLVRQRPAAPPSQSQLLDGKIGVPVSTTTCLSSLTAASDIDVSPAAAPLAGVVAGAVLRAARLSARLTPAQLGEAVGVGEPVIGAWEAGCEPLADVAYPILQRLEAELAAAGAGADLVHDLTPAIWCDLVIAAVSDGQDISCLLADPTAAEPEFGELLAWSAGFCPPARYRPCAAPGQLFPAAAHGRLARAIRELSPTGGPAGGRAA
jgi:hypothetical protein